MNLMKEDYDFQVRRLIHGVPEPPQDMKLDATVAISVWPNCYILTSANSYEKIWKNEEEGWREMTRDERDEYHFWQS